MILFFPITAATTIPAPRSNAACKRRLFRASKLVRPCVRAFVLPHGAPVDLPPCIRQQPLAMAGLRQGVLVRVRALHRWAANIGAVFRGWFDAFAGDFLLCMGLISRLEKILSREDRRSCVMRRVCAWVRLRGECAGDIEGSP
jgi:hypothetical protein